MKLCDKIVTRHKIRDLKICQLANEGEQGKDIAQQFGISRQRVSAILYANRGFLQETVDWAKVKRVHKLNRLLNRIPDDLAPKNVGEAVQVIEQLRKELEGDKPSVEVHNNNVSQVFFPVQNDGSFIEQDQQNA